MPKQTEKLIKANVHFYESEWERLMKVRNEEEKKAGYPISVNKFLRKLILKVAEKA